MKLYDYFRSSAAYRVRIALNLKGVGYEHVGVHLVRDGGEQHKPAYKAVNPQGRVPTLELEDGTRIIQSPAILEFIEERWPEPALLPKDDVARAHVRALAAVIACDIHPLNNLSSLGLLRGKFGADEAGVSEWYAHWITQGFATIEALLGDTPFAGGEEPGLAEVYLVPQVFNARRFNVPLEAFPKIVAIDAAAAALPAFVKAHPDNQPDAA
ncbi:MAG: maleylacetoacetate isomerase [Hyphomicrobiales bacterium]|nr:MAG: maleylacetoacetate isomerase [Hyphomicrobiales bacterium]